MILIVDNGEDPPHPFRRNVINWRVEYSTRIYLRLTLSCGHKKRLCVDEENTPPPITVECRRCRAKEAQKR